MNWLSDFNSDDSAVFDASGKPARRGRLSRFRHGLKVRRTRAKSVWKKLPKRFKKNAKIVLGSIAALAALAAAIWYFYPKHGKTESSVASAFPVPNSPALPIFDDDVLSTDPAAVPRRWRWIVVHHSGGNSGSAQSFDAYHRETKGWQSLGYHFVIGNGKGQGDGKIAAGPRWYAQQTGAHAHSAEHNEFGIGICLVGSFDTQIPSPAEWQALVDITRKLSKKYGIPLANIVGHNQIRQGGSTACPGKNLNIQALRDAVVEP